MVSLPGVNVCCGLEAYCTTSTRQFILKIFILCVQEFYLCIKAGKVVLMHTYLRELSLKTLDGKNQVKYSVMEKFTQLSIILLNKESSFLIII